MAVSNLGANMTLSESARRENPDGSIADLIDVLSEEHGVLQVATMRECNNGTFHEDKRVTSKAAGEWRGYGLGVTGEANTSETIVEPTSMLDGLSEIDAAQLRHTPNELAVRMMEDDLFMSGMANTLASTFFDGNRATNSKQFTGINNRPDWNQLDSDTVYDTADGAASVTANKTSLYIVQFGYKMVDMVYPRNDPGGTQFGISMEDYGKSIVTQASGKKLPMWQTWFEAHYGIFVYDPRTIKRVCNISTTNIDEDDDFSFNENIMFDALGELEHNGRNAHIFVNRTLWTQMRKRANTKGNAYFMEQNGEGPWAKTPLSVDGIPIHREDQITNTQAAVT